MRDRTADALDAINDRFYREHAADFDRTRTRGWQGWERVRSLLPATRPGRRLRLGDFGCGNGRFARTLTGGDDVRYLGLDRSLPLLRAVGRGRAGAPPLRRTGVAADLVATELPLRQGSLDVAVAFGLFHHIPSFARRSRLLGELASTLRPGGRLVVSFWQFADEPRFATRTAPWSGSGPGDRTVDPNDLEEGDYLLRWGDGDAVRYCHHTAESEIDGLLAQVVAVGGRELDRWSADGRSGRLNRYVAVERKPG